MGPFCSGAPAPLSSGQLTPLDQRLDAEDVQVAFSDELALERPSFTGFVGGHLVLWPHAAGPGVGQLHLGGQHPKDKHCGHGRHGQTA
eukprot:scaffold1444_cov134-Isochrysis_galbana.AAC.7